MHALFVLFIGLDPPWPSRYLQQRLKAPSVIRGQLSRDNIYYSGSVIMSRETTKDYDDHEQHVWLLEPAIPQGHNVLTAAGADNIAHHKYKGGAYTALDSFLSPNVWEPLTQALPLWLAPNLITTIGGCFCLMSYLVSSYILPAGIDAVDLPRWLFAFNGLCLAIYYTFDCCDGKQARRTKSSSPLGQL
jgi:hypothetical protein